MALTAEVSSRTVLATPRGSRIFRALLAFALMALAANCFLKYLWWTACYSAWYGIPKMAAQSKAAGSRATFNGWSFVLLDVASVAILYTATRFRLSKLSDALKIGVRLAVSLGITIAATAAFALAISWVKQGIQ